MFCKSFVYFSALFAMSSLSTSALAIDLPGGFSSDISQVGNNVMYQTSNAYGSLSTTDQTSQTLIFFNGGGYGSMFGNINKTTGASYFSNSGCGLVIDEEGEYEWVDDDDDPIPNPYSYSYCEDLEETIDRYHSFVSAELEVIEADLDDIDPYLDNTIDDSSVQALTCKQSRVIGVVSAIGVSVTVAKTCYGSIGLACAWAAVEGAALLLVIQDWVEEKCN